MKKIVAIALAIMMMALAAPLSAFAADPIASGTKLDIGEITFSDYTDKGQGKSDPLSEGTAEAKVVKTNGVNNSDSIKITRDYPTNKKGHVEVNFALENKGTLGTNKYLVVWADFTNVEMRKACFGLEVDDHYYAYRTDDDDTSPTFYYMADGTTEWVTLSHDGDGCFGAHDDGKGPSPVKGKKGYFAFPVEDFLNDEKNDAAPAADSLITGVYFFATFPTADYINVPFYFDDMQLVEDYTTVTAPEVEDEPTTPPATGDAVVYFAFAALVALAGVVVVAKKRVRN